MQCRRHWKLNHKHNAELKHLHEYGLIGLITCFKTIKCFKAEIYNRALATLTLRIVPNSFTTLLDLIKLLSQHIYNVYTQAISFTVKILECLFLKYWIYK